MRPGEGVPPRYEREEESRGARIGATRHFPPHPMRAATGLLENSNQSGRRAGTEPSDWTAASPRLG